MPSYLEISYVDIKMFLKGVIKWEIRQSSLPELGPTHVEPLMNNKRKRVSPRAAPFGQTGALGAPAQLPVASGPSQEYGLVRERSVVKLSQAETRKQ